MTKTIPTLAALMLLLASPSAFAQGSSAQRAACTPDVFRFCSSDIPNVGQITACLKREKPKLSSACRTVLEIAEKPVQTVATRSIVKPKSEWCRFDRADAGGQDQWRTWCGGDAWGE